jgi:hypothetical protein
MNLELALGIALIITRGTTEQTRFSLSAGLDLATRLNESDAQVRGLWALWSVQFNARECLERAQSTAERLEAIAFQNRDHTVGAVALRMIGYTLQLQGDQRAARINLESALQPSVDENYGHRLFVYNQSLLTRACWRAHCGCRASSIRLNVQRTKPDGMLRRPRTS